MKYSHEQDNPDYWNNLERIKTDTCKATLEDVKLDPLFGYGEAVLSNYSDITKWIKSFDSLIPNKGNVRTVVDFGCGGGYHSLRWCSGIKKEGLGEWEIVLVDQSSVALNIAKSRLSQVFPGVALDSFCTSSMEVGKKADVIFTNTSLQHNSKQKKNIVINGFLTTLNSGGLLYLINEKTFCFSEDGHLPLWELVKKNPFYEGSNGTDGTAPWWIGLIASRGFELLHYFSGSYTFRKLS